MGCFAKGCIVSAIIVLVGGVILVGATIWFIYGVVGPFVGHSPVAIRTYPATPAQYAQLSNRLNSFGATLASSHTATLRLTADDLNTYIARDPQAQSLRGHLFVSIVRDELEAETSFPLPNRNGAASTENVYYFNGIIYLAASFSGGDLACEFHRIERLDGKPAPAIVTALLANPGFMRGFNNGFSRSFNQSFHEQLNRNSTAADFVAKIRTIIIQDNSLVITADDH